MLAVTRGAPHAARGLAREGQPWIATERAQRVQLADAQRLSIAATRGTTSFGPQSQFYIDIGGVDQILEGGGVGLYAGFQFHVPHILSAAFQQSGGIDQIGAEEEADVGVALEDVDVGERDILNADDGVAVVHELQNVLATGTHSLEPRARDGCQGV